MTDKIKINGVDVSRCDCKYCMENPTCYKQISEKQLARKDERVRELELLNSQMTCKLEKLAHENGELKQKLKQIAQLTQKLRTKTDYHGEDEVNADLDQILEIINSRGNDER